MLEPVNEDKEYTSSIMLLFRPVFKSFLSYAALRHSRSLKFGTENIRRFQSVAEIGVAVLAGMWFVLEAHAS